MSELTQRAWRVHGRVQGVGFRWWAVQAGVGLGLVGRVRNDPDGTVVLHARGGTDALELMSAKLRVGPMMARVSRVEELEPTGPWPDAGIEVER